MTDVVRVSVVTLTWNNLEYTKKALESIRGILKENDELIVVDNNSTDGTKEYLEGLHLPCAKIIRFNDKHISITEGYNIGIRESKGKYVFIYDNDLEIVEPNTLDHMISVFEQHDDAGIVCSHCDNIIGRLRPIKSAAGKINRIELIPMKRMRPYPICPSAAWLVKRETIDKVGLFDENYKGYGMLDFDYARSVLLAGLKIYLDGFIFVKHYGSVTANTYDIQPQLLESRNYFYRKWKLPLTDSMKLAQKRGH